MKKLILSLILSVGILAPSSSPILAVNGYAVSVSQPAYFGGQGTVTFTAPIAHPWASASCFQGKDFVWNQNIDLSLTNTLTFSGQRWISGGADCNIYLWDFDAKHRSILAKNDFTVLP